MEWSKLKNIMILMLLVVNALLLVMVVTRESSSARYLEQALTETLAVLERGGVQVSRNIVPDEPEPPLAVERDQSGEPALAAALLGQVQVQDLGSGRYLYRGALGSAEFRSNGNFSFAFEADALPVEAGESFSEHALDCMEKLGFQGEVLSVEKGERTSVTLRQLWQELPVFSCTVVLTYQDGRLRAITGERLMGVPASAAEAETPISTPTALLRFFSGISALGDVCSEITAIQAGYQLTAAETNWLTPTWYITTDTGSYFLNILTGELVRQMGG